MRSAMDKNTVLGDKGNEMPSFRFALFGGRKQVLMSRGHIKIILKFWRELINTPD